MTRSSSTSAIASERATAQERDRRRPLAALAWFLVLCPLAPGPARAGTEPSLTSVLDRVGEQVAGFWNYLPAVTCTEVLTQSKLGDKGKVLFERRATYDYLVLLQSAGGEIEVDESRVERNHKELKGNASLLQTDGFSILALIFHPQFQSRYEFTELPDDKLDGRPLLRVAFRQIMKNQSPSVLLLRKREYPLEWKGTAWIDPSTYAVTRIRAGLGTSMEDLGLLSLDAEVSYSVVHFNGSITYWLPAKAVIEAATKRQHWRNTHLFSTYRRFDVQTEVTTATPH